MPQIVAGDVIRVLAHFTRPPKQKILLCVDPARFKYLVINSDPYLLALAAQLKVSPAEVPGLDHDSHVDTSKLVTLSAMETQYVIDADARCHKGSAPAAVLQRIKALIAQHGIMPKDQMAIVAANL